MRKLIVLICICSSAISGYSQVWENINIDSGICVSIPKQYLRKDTLKDYSITARAVFGNILITKISDIPLVTPDIYKKRHLDIYYKNYIKNILASSRGTVSDQKDTLLGKLRVRDFILHQSDQEGHKSRKFRILHENSATYTFQFLYDDLAADYAKPEMDRFFNSISLIRDFDLESQFTKLREGEKRTFFTGRNVGIGAGILVILVLGYLYMRKRRRTA